MQGTGRMVFGQIERSFRRTIYSFSTVDSRNGACSVPSDTPIPGKFGKDVALEDGADNEHEKAKLAKFKTAFSDRHRCALLT
jgi:hypothetical protein